MGKYVGLVGLSLVVCGCLAACKSADPMRQSALSTNAMMQVAETADTSGASELGLSMYKQAAASDPGNVDLQLRYVDALIRRGSLAEARQLLAERLSARP